MGGLELGRSSNQNTKEYPLYKAPLLCFGYFMGCLRLDAATSTSPCASQFLLCPMSRVGIYPSVHVTFIKLLFRFGQHALVPVLQYYHCCFPSRENMGLSGLYPQNPLSLPGTSSPHWAKTPLSKHQLSHHDAWPRPEYTCGNGLCICAAFVWVAWHLPVLGPMGSHFLVLHTEVRGALQIY